MIFKNLSPLTLLIKVFIKRFNSLEVLLRLLATDNCPSLTYIFSANKEALEVFNTLIPKISRKIKIRIYIFIKNVLN
ncbi:MAG: hypothetical protein K2P12_02050, partial [Clostridia bacterium]|nr:hypothetical protein [Clostridia bacterium]